MRLGAQIQALPRRAGVSQAKQRRNRSIARGRKQRLQNGDSPPATNRWSAKVTRESKRSTSSTRQQRKSGPLSNITVWTSISPPQELCRRESAAGGATPNHNSVLPRV